MTFNNGDGFGNGTTGGGGGGTTYSAGGMAPNYATMSNDNKITAKDGTWVVDRIGYVYCGLTIDFDSYVGNVGFDVLVDNKNVYNIDKVAGMGISGTSTVGVTIPVLPNQTVKLTGVESGSSVNYFCYWIAPRILNMSPPTMAPDFNNVMCVPDYSNMESINRISASGQTWTADRSGFVWLFTGKGGGSWNSQQVEWYINDIMCETGTAYYVNVILPIQQGDVIRLYANVALNAAYCRYIPPKFIEIEPSPIIVETAGSYSTNEQQTQTTWIDGKPIYKKTVNVPNATSWAVGQVNLGVTIPDIDKIIDYTMIVQSSDTTLYKSNTYANVRELRMGINSSGVLVGYMPASIGGMVANTMICTLWYTKTTD